MTVRLDPVALHLVLLCLVGSRAEAGYKLFWNVGGAPGIDLSPFPLVVNSQLELFTTYFGDFPEIQTSGRWCNGGIPQLANLTAHVAKVGSDFLARTNATFDGYVVVDYEAWWASWNATPAVYQNASIKLVAAQNPTMPPAQVLAQAISDYNKASQTFIIATMDAVRATCPNCKVGMYSYPIRAYWDGYCSSFGPALRNVSDSMIDVFHASDALFPSIYEFYDTAPASQKKQYVDCMVGEAVRLANSSVPPKRVLPYGWPRYHSAANNLLTPSDTDLSFAEPGRIPGVTGAVIWGDAGDNTTRVAELQAWMQANKGVFSVPPSRQHALWQSKPAGASSVTLPGQQVPALSAGPSIAAAAELVEQVRNSPVGSFPPPFEFCGL